MYFVCTRALSRARLCKNAVEVGSLRLDVLVGVVEVGSLRLTVLVGVVEVGSLRLAVLVGVVEVGSLRLVVLVVVDRVIEEGLYQKNMQGRLGRWESGRKGWMWDRGSGGKMSGESQQPAVSSQLLTSQLLPNFKFSAGAGLHKLEHLSTYFMYTLLYIQPSSQPLSPVLCYPAKIAVRTELAQSEFLHVHEVVLQLLHIHGYSMYASCI